MYFHCQTTLVDTFKEMYRDRFRFEGNRSIVFSENEKIPMKELRYCIFLALTYRLRKKQPILTVSKHITSRSTGPRSRLRGPSAD